jgi:hypothetical protein
MIYRPQRNGPTLADSETIATMHRCTQRHARRITAPTACDIKTRRLLYPLPEPPPMSYPAR